MSKVRIEKTHTFSGHRDCIYALEPSGSENLFFTAAGDGMVVEWNLDLPDQGKLLAKVEASVYALHYWQEQNWLVIGQNFEGLHFIDLESRLSTGSLNLGNVPIFDMISVDPFLFVAMGNGEILKIDAHQRIIVKRLKLSDKSARCLAFNSSRNELVIGFSDFKIRILDLEDWELKLEISLHQNSVFTVRFSPDFRYLLSSGRDANIKVFDVENHYQQVQNIVAHMYAINHICFSPDGAHFATASMDKSIKLWDAHDFSLLKVIDRARHAGHGTSVNRLMWSKHHNQLVSCSDDRTVSVWKIDFNA